MMYRFKITWTHSTLTTTQAITVYCFKLMPQYFAVLGCCICGAVSHRDSDGMPYGPSQGLFLP